MTYYKVHDTWENFFNFIKQRLEKIDKDKISFMYKTTRNAQDIYIASLDDSALKIIKGQYDLTLCEQPDNFIKNDWAYTGNQNLFDLKL